MITDGQVQAWEDVFESGVYAKQLLVLVRGRGAEVWDSSGRRYLDCIAGHGVANIGHAHPAVAAAIASQSERLSSCPNNFYSDVRSAYLAELMAVAPAGMERAFLCNSGAEAVEAAIKFARLATGRAEIAAAMRGFHGRTLGALSVTWRRDYRTPFEPLVPGVQFVPYNRPEALESALSDRTAALILEVVQGEGGVIPGTADYLRRAQTLCRERGVLLIIDEVQTGFGRTGRFFACQHHDLQPDLVCLAKAIAGGLPMGAVLIGERVGALPGRSHGSTFGGNPLACAAARATLRVIQDEDLPRRAEERGAQLMAGLQGIGSPSVREVRGLGLMVAAELRRAVAPVLVALAERGVLALPAGKSVMRFLPPLVIDSAQVEEVLAAAEAALEATGG